MESCDWDLLRELLGVLEVEDSVEPALLAREMGRGTGVTGGESSCGGEGKGQHLPIYSEFVTFSFIFSTITNNYGLICVL